jgi:hypothetical protein
MPLHGGPTARPWDDFSPLPLLSAKRLSLEFKDAPYLSAPNLQSFMVWKREN